MVGHDDVLKVSDTCGDAATVRWTADTRSTLWRTWSDESVVYLELESSTHLLGATATPVLQALLDSATALSIDGVAFAAFDMTAPGQAGAQPLSGEERSALQATLADLEKIGAIRQQLP